MACMKRCTQELGRPTRLLRQIWDDDIEARRGNPDTGLCVTLSFDLKQEGEPKRKWRDSGWVGVVSGIVL